jgi:hypothetical protein
MNQAPDAHGDFRGDLIEARFQIIGAEHDDDEVERRVAHDAGAEIPPAILDRPFDRVVVDRGPAAEAFFNDVPRDAELTLQDPWPPPVQGESVKR